MSLKDETRIPRIDLTNDPADLVEGSEGWKKLCREVREAGEEYGCFQVIYNKIPMQIREEMFKASKELFDLPKEIKEKNTSHNAYYGYIGNIDRIPLFESMGFADASSLETTQSFTGLFWPDGYPSFCQTVNSIGKKVHELELLILKMIMESYGLEGHYSSYVESTASLCRIMKYKSPKDNLSELGLTAHVDKSALTILSQNSVQGLEVLLKGDEWINVISLDDAFTVFIGDALKAWSNGRLHAARHRVMMSGDKTRYSFASVTLPKDETVVEAPKELIDEAHPQLFRPFKYIDFFKHYQSTLNEDDALEVYAGI
ncbi:hypothetical protein ACHQM5_023876 [Ranunculus cassubicifolius]